MIASPSFLRALNFVLSDHIEGGFSDDPEDPGNWTGGAKDSGELRGTKYGISAKAYPQLDIRALRYDEVVGIYWRDYWVKIRGDDLPPRVAFAVFDCAVNQGVAAAAQMLQASVGADVDGIIGPATISAVRQREQTDVLVDFLARRAVRYASLSTFKRFGRGWMRRLFYAMESSR